MKHVIETKLLLKSLKSASSVLSSVNTIPALDGYLFKIGDGVLTIISSNVENTMSVSTPLSYSDGEDTVVVPNKILSIVSNISDEKIEFLTDSPRVTLKTSSGSYSLTGFAAEEYPSVYTTGLEGSNCVILQSSFLQEVSKKTLFAVGKDVMNRVLCGINYTSTPSGTFFAATDAHKLIRILAPALVSDNNVSLILSKQTMALLKNNLPKESTNVVITYNEKNIHFSFNDTIIVSKLIEGRYPNIENVIPKDNSCTAIVNRKGLLQSLQRVSIFANQTTQRAKLEFGVGSIKINAEDVDVETRGEDTIACDYDGEPLTIGFNAKFLIEMLSNIEEEKVIIKLSSPTKPCVLLPKVDEKAEANTETLMLLMPIVL